MTTVLPHPSRRDVEMLEVDAFLKPLAEWQKQSARLRGLVSRGDGSSTLHKGLRELRQSIAEERARFLVATASGPGTDPIRNVGLSFERLLSQIDLALLSWSVEQAPQDRQWSRP